MHRKARDYAPPPLVPRPSSPVPRLPSPVPRLPSLVPRPRRTAKRMRPSPRPRRAAKRPRPSPRPPSRRRSGPSAGKAAPRRAGQQALLKEVRSRPGTPVLRPLAHSKASAPVPGKVQEGAGAPSWFPPPLAVERSRIIFRHGVYVTKNPSHGATCETGPAPRGWTRFAPKRSAQAICPDGFAVQARAPSGKWQSHFPEISHGKRPPNGRPFS